MVKVTRLLLVDGVPLIYAVDHLLPAYSYLRAEDLEKESLNALMTRDGPSRTLTSRERTFEAVAAAPVQARLLGIPAGEPLLLVYDVVVDENGVPLRYTREFVAGDKVKYAYILPPRKGINAGEGFGSGAGFVSFHCLHGEVWKNDGSLCYPFVF